MRKLVVSEFMSVDGVMEDPGGDGSFKHGGWTRPYGSEKFMKFKAEELLASDILLLGRVTYDGFAKAWPNISGTGAFGEKMNSMKKYVVSSTLKDPSWENSEIIHDNAPDAVKNLKNQDGGDILVAGSSQLLRTLMEHNLVDEYRIVLYPVVLGSGKRLFSGDVHAGLDLTSSEDFGNGVVLLIYRPDKS